MKSNSTATIICVLTAFWVVSGVHGFVPRQVQPLARNRQSTISSSIITKAASTSNRSHSRRPISFKHLFRHYDDISMDCWLRCAEPLAFLQSCGFTQEEIGALAKEFPKLLEQDVHDHLAPHIRFFVRTLGGGTGDLIWAEDGYATVEKEEECQVDNDDADSERHQLHVSTNGKQALPASYFNIRLEKSLAPWHAYLVWQGLPSGGSLLEDSGSKLREFLEVCSSNKLPRFVDLCNEWDMTDKTHTLEQVSEFQYAFHEGLVPAVRNHLHTNTECPPGRMVELLLSHGANHLEDDHHGASLLHWSAGTGNLKAVKALIQAGIDDGVTVNEVISYDHTSKDGATPLHWAACGVTSQGVFGSGGHPDVCRLLLDLAGKNLNDETTYNHNSALEWAAWSGSLEVVKLLVEEYEADVHFCSENGNAAHWACAGGSLPVCQYLADECNVDFSIKSEAKGLTPLDLAGSEGHDDVVEWLVRRFHARDVKGQEQILKELNFGDLSDAVEDVLRKKPWSAPL